MSRKLFFEDGSTLEVAISIPEDGKMATLAYQKLIDFLDDDLIDDPELSIQAEEDLHDLEDDELDEDDLVDDDEDEFDKEDFEEDEEWEEEDFEDEWSYEDDFDEPRSRWVVY